MARSNHLKNWIEHPIKRIHHYIQRSKTNNLSVCVPRTLPSLRVTCTLVRKSYVSFTRLHVRCPSLDWSLPVPDSTPWSRSFPHPMSSSRRGCHLPPEQGGDLLPNGLTRTARPSSHQLASMEQPFLLPPREPNGGPGLGAPIPPLRRPNDRETRQSRYQNQVRKEAFFWTLRG